MAAAESFVAIHTRHIKTTHYSGLKSEKPHKSHVLVSLKDQEKPNVIEILIKY